VLGRNSMVTVYSEQTDPRFAPRGVLGGTEGQPSRITIFDPDGRKMPVGSKASLRVRPGSVIRIETSGGGGYGDPARRDPALRAADEQDGRG
jgi:N-methylhydantoinase B